MIVVKFLILLFNGIVTGDDFSEFNGTSIMPRESNTCDDINKGYIYVVDFMGSILNVERGPQMKVMLQDATNIPPLLMFKKMIPVAWNALEYPETCKRMVTAVEKFGSFIVQFFNIPNFGQGTNFADLNQMVKSFNKLIEQISNNFSKDKLDTIFSNEFWSQFFSTSQIVIRDHFSKVMDVFIKYDKASKSDEFYRRIKAALEDNLNPSRKRRNTDYNISSIANDMSRNLIETINNVDTDRLMSTANDVLETGNNINTNNFGKNMFEDSNMFTNNMDGSTDAVTQLVMGLLDGSFDLSSPQAIGQIAEKFNLNGIMEEYMNEQEAMIDQSCKMVNDASGLAKMYLDKINSGMDGTVFGFVQDVLTALGIPNILAPTLPVEKMIYEGSFCKNMMTAQLKDMKSQANIIGEKIPELVSKMMKIPGNLENINFEEITGETVSAIKTATYDEILKIIGETFDDEQMISLLNGQEGLKFMRRNGMRNLILEYKLMSISGFDFLIKYDKSKTNEKFYERMIKLVNQVTTDEDFEEAVVKKVKSTLKFPIKIVGDINVLKPKICAAVSLQFTRKGTSVDSCDIISANLSAEKGEVRRRRSESQNFNVEIKTTQLLLEKLEESNSVSDEDREMVIQNSITVLQRENPNAFSNNQPGDIEFLEMSSDEGEFKKGAGGGSIGLSCSIMISVLTWLLYI